jgi:tellurite resistance protein TerC
MTARRAIALTVAWLAAGLAVGLPVLASAGSDHAVSYWAVYVVERSLSLDNIFVFLLILDAFAIPRRYRRRVVLWGIGVALALRFAAVAVGAELLTSFAWVTYVLGGALLIVGLRLLRSRPEGAVRLDRAPLRWVPSTPDHRAGAFVARVDGRWLATPLGLALLAMVVADLTFAVDSIPASFGITTNVLIICLANTLAMLGLFPLMALVRVLVSRFRYMAPTMAVILVFIAARLLTEHVVSIGPAVSLGVIAAILTGGIVSSVVADRSDPPAQSVQAGRRPPRCPPSVEAGTSLPT